MEINATQIILFVITIIFAIVTRYVIPWLRAKLSDHDKEEIDYWLTIFESAAESYFGKSMGAAKKSWVIDQMVVKMAELGINIDGEIIQDLIEEKYRDLVVDGKLQWGENKASQEAVISVKE